MTDILKTISQFIEYHFPEHYRENDKAPNEYERALIIDFVEAYYEFIEQNRQDYFLRNRDMFDYADIDKTLTEFVDYFKTVYLRDLPYVYSVDDRFAVKHIIDMYRAKGTEASLKLLIRLLFNQDIEIYYPAQDVLRPSHSVWSEPRYLELTRSSRSRNFVGKRITGSLSGANAYAQSLVTKRVNGKFIDILYISDIRGGNFQTGEFISDDGVIRRAPQLIGSLRSVDVVLGGSGYSVGDRLSIESSEGKNARARITEVRDPSNLVDFELVDGGYGYSLTDSSVYVSTAILFCNNASQDFTIFETVTQSLARVTTNNAVFAEIGDVVIGLDSTANVIANGIIVDINDDSNSFVIEERSGSFEKQYILDLQDANKFVDGEIIEEEDSLEIEVADVTAPFTPGERVLQRELIDGVYQNIAIGKYISVALDTFIVENAFGEFIPGLTLEGLDSGSFANIVSVTTTSSGVSGEIISSSNTSITVRPFGAIFSSNNQIRGQISKNINTITTVTDEGLQSISISGNTSFVESYANVSASGFVLGQDVEKVGLFGNTNPFYFVSGATNLIATNSFTKELTRVGKGFGADFDVGTLNPDTIETGNIVSDLIGGENVIDIEYLDILVAANNSGINKLSANVVIVDGGSGYANGEEIVFSGGGYLDGDPIISAVGEVFVDANGTITDVNILDRGQGYYNVPSYSIAGGSSANLQFTVEQGYGFPKDPTVGFDGIINDALGEREITIGEIASIKNINRGEQYDTGVFVRVINEEVQDFLIKDVVLEIANSVGTFEIGEIIEDDSSGAKGRVRSIDLDNNTVNVKNLSFFNRFTVGDNLTGATSNTTAIVTDITELTTDLSMGENAEFDTEVIFEEGVISQIEITDSGYGYVDGRPVSLINANNQFVTSGIGNVTRQGIGTGYWKTKSSHLNDKFLHDNRFYQEFSYQVVSGLSFERYEDIVKDLLHVAGTELFGRVELQSISSLNYALSSSIVVGDEIIASGAFIGDPNVANTPFTQVGLDGTNSGVGRLEYAVIIANAGIGYSNTANVQIIGGGLGNTEPDIPAEASIVTDDDGRIVDFSINIEGEGYYSVPQVIIPGGTGANVIIDVEFGYGFIRDPYSNINSIIGDTLGSGQSIFVPTQVLFDD